MAQEITTRGRMKKLGEIIDEVMDGGRPEYDELRYALIAVNALRGFDSRAIMKLWDKERNGKYKANLFGLEWEARESHTRAQKAMEVDPKTYVGPDHDPDNPECQKFRKAAKNMMTRMKQRTGEKTS